MKILILGFGQDAQLMAEKCESEQLDYRIMLRRSSSIPSKIDSLNIKIERLFYVNEINLASFLKLHKIFQYSHVYNLAANSFVQDSVDQFDHFLSSNSKILWSIFELDDEIEGLWHFHPLSSEIYSQDSTGSLLLSPRNAYGVAKAAEALACEVKRKLTNIEINSCILFNHESTRRAPQFFTKKVISYFQKCEPNQILKIYNSQSARDWGYAPEYIDLILEAGRNRITGSTELGTGFLMTVEAFIDFCFKHIGVEFEKVRNAGLLTWHSKILKVVEISSDEQDASRSIKADAKSVISSFGRLPVIKGETLVATLLREEV